MLDSWQGHGFRFQYPTGLAVSQEGNDFEHSVTVAITATAFWSLTIVLDGPRVESVLESALDAFRQEYNEMDVYPADQSICGQPATGRDVDFLCQDLTNFARIRVFQAGGRTALVLAQGSDYEREDVVGVMDALTAGLEVSSESSSAADFA